MSRWRHFTEDEAGVPGLDLGLVDLLDDVRERAGVPIVITEGLAARGSHVANTAHARGLSVDIRCSRSRDRFLLLEALFHYGVTRIGQYSGHLHVDIDTSLPPRVAWLGGQSH